MEHLQHFGLARDPFCNEPLLDLFLETAPHRDALRRLDRGVRQRKGLCVLTGAPGAGKTMVVRRLFEDLEEELFEAGMLVVPNGSADGTWLLRRLARQLGVEEPRSDRESLLAEIYDRLAIVREDGRHAVLIIDDAQALASEDALAQVCSLLKLEYEERRLLSLVLAGDPPLAEMIAAEPALAQRVDVKVDLQPLDAAAGGAYVGHRLQAAGGAVSILDGAAVARLQQLGSGLPGRINTLADNALFEAFLHGHPQVTEADVELAARSLSWDSQPPIPVPATPVAPAVPVAPPTPVAPATPRAPSTAPPAPAPAPLPEPTLEILSDDPELVPPPPPHTPAPAFDELDSELEAAFASGEIVPLEEAPQVPRAAARPVAPAAPVQGPPKDDDDIENLLVELIDD